MPNSLFMLDFFILGSLFVTNNFLTIFLANFSLFTLEVRHFAEKQYIQKVLFTFIAVVVYNKKKSLAPHNYKITEVVCSAVDPG